jgi:hypothetical protein
LQEKRWRHPDTTYYQEADRAISQGMMKVYDVTRLQPLLLWEVPSLRESRGKRKQHLPVSAVLCRNRLE